MRFIDLYGNLQRARRYVSSTTTIDVKELEDKDKLAQKLRELSRRITELEARTPPEATEFEVMALDGSQVAIQHGLGGPVRYWTTSLGNTPGGPPTVAPVALVLNTESTDDRLVLDVFGDFKGVIRVEPSQYGVVTTT